MKGEHVVVGICTSAILGFLVHALSGVFSQKAPVCWVEPDQADDFDFGEVLVIDQGPIYCGVTRHSQNVSHTERVCLPMRAGVGIECVVGKVRLK